VSGVPRWVLVAAFLRSFMIQGSWNYRTMIGGGFGFSILPVLRWIHRGDPEALVEATSRHTEHFNAHPYLAGLALGATARLEIEGTPSDTVTRFKSAVRGPLGGLGDRLVWAGWLPCTVLAALILAAVGADPLVVVVTFLALYNVGHLAFRIWAFRAGVEVGPAVARRLHDADMRGKAESLQTTGAMLLGGLAGLLAARAVAAGPGGWLLAVMGTLSFVLGARLGVRAWQPMAAGLAFLILLTTVAGMLT